jgi:hypothetical protein
VNEEDRACEKLTHIVIVDQNGGYIQTIEVPSGVAPEELELLAVSNDANAKTHLPISTGLPPFDLVAPTQLPIPREKIKKELFLGKLIIPFIRQAHNLDDPIELSTNPNDPPDLLLTTPTRAIGIELCELIYPERHLNDSLLLRFEEAIRRKLAKDSFSNYQLYLMLKSAPDGTLRLPKRPLWDTVISDLLPVLDQVKGLACVKGATSVLPEEHLPESCRSYMQLVMLDYIGPPSNLSPVRPIIRFANRQQEFSGDALRSIVSGPIERKLDMKLAGINILLIWSQHRSFRFCISETSEAIIDLLLHRMRSAFLDVLYLHRSTENIIGILMLNRQISVRVKEERQPPEA